MIRYPSPYTFGIACVRTLVGKITSNPVKEKEKKKSSRVIYILGDHIEDIFKNNHCLTYGYCKATETRSVPLFGMVSSLL